ncbi:uncharacterized protein MONOS_2237 [Monocercomonoides exilis]|uniref:uncharacterized protein n=1 Tax=Monocercomonoides exilis TaxID=2049356 RepID=UPI00355A037A|nr:hypothetical protein MONOS_2237 [Monocercomonoides exilis]|eukprot:MONOS_2237.1-p1 / transcript=MONOS_2237.1 / gene=MONOS_2237 / organism=Monocercomonoides_exilis_PA203 / gene_product=unspecified product / transcript_product=unspecified product / location=Mono_scaffold00045:37408-38058(-) / protein_length=181 / sequence_SO=supercontig / SO=protein_coding / is_pseudo=false
MEVLQRRAIAESQILTEEEQQREIHALEKENEIMSKRFRVAFGSASFFFVGLYLALFYFSTFHGASVLLPSCFDAPFSSLAFLISAISVAIAGLFLQSDAVQMRLAVHMKKLSFCCSICIATYWMLIFIFGARFIPWKYSWVPALPFVIHGLNVLVEKDLSAVREQMEDLKGSTYECKGA